jgi:hypothetical protein|tara:strand:+ start:42 stop:236 length:195 start_codon:yes stop_codon:yes gene_type:complete
MSDEVQKIVDSVRTGNNIESEKSFKDAMTAKVGDALEVRRQEVSSTIVKTIVPEDSVDDNVNEE